MSNRRNGGRDRHQEAKEKLRRILQRLQKRIQGLSQRAVDFLTDSALFVFPEEDDTVFSASAVHDFSYVLIEGLVRLECHDHHKRPNTIQLIAPGRLFGVNWLPGRRAREVRAVAHVDSAVAILSQDAVASVCRSLDDKTGLMGYAWRALSGLLVQKAEARSLELPERILHAFRALIRDFGEARPDGIHLRVSQTSEDVARLVGAYSVRHEIAELQECGQIARDSFGHFVLTQPAPAVTVTDRSPDAPYRGIPIPSARALLRNLVARCRYLTTEAMDLVHRNAALLHVPAGETLLPPDSGEVVAFVVEGSAWLEATGITGKRFGIQIVPPCRFVRLPTGASSGAARLGARAHQDCTVGLLTLGQMAEVIRVLPTEKSFTLLDVTCRALSRHLCDCTTAPTRSTACRLLSTFGFLARDFQAEADEGVLIDVPITHDDLTPLLDVERPTITKAIKELVQRGCLERVAHQTYVLRKLPWSIGADGSCPICIDDPGPPE